MSTPDTTIEAINAKTAARVRTYFDARDDWNLSRSLKNLIEQAIRDYEHRTVLELVQNAHDAQTKGSRNGRILIRLDHDEGEHGTLIVANTGNPFSPSNFDAICDVAQSDKRADEGIGNKGIGFKSTLQLCQIPEIFSASAVCSETFDGYCFRFANDDDLLAAVDGDKERAQELIGDVFHLCLPVAIASVPPSIAPLRSEGYVTAIRLPLKSEAAREEAREEVHALEQGPPALLFLRRLSALVVEEREHGEIARRVHDRQERSVVELDVRTSVIEVRLGDDAIYLVAERVVDPAAFRSAIERSVEADRISAGWADWRGEVRVGIGITTGEQLPEGRLYTFLPMGEHATAPLPAHVNAPFFVKLARVSFEESVPLNDFLLDEVASLATALVLGRSDGSLQLEPTTVADLLSWTSSAYQRLVSAFEGRDRPLASTPVLPLQDRGAWGSLIDTRCWADGERFVFIDKSLRRSAKVKLLHTAITGMRLDRLDVLVQEVAGRSLKPSEVEIADWAEALAEARSKTTFSPHWWENFYDELADANTDRAALRGRKILLDDDLRLQRCAGADESRGPTPFFSPKADDVAASEPDDDLRIPQTLKRRIFFVNQRLRWTQRKGTTLVRRPGRRMLEQAGLVHEYRAAEVFGVLNRALRDRPSAARSQDALRWAYRFVRSRDDPPWSEMAGVAFQVPTAEGGWIPAAKALFSRDWGAIDDEVLDDFISKTAGLSDHLDVLARRLIPAPADWPFEIDDRPKFREFLERIGVRAGLWPQPVPRSVLSSEGRFFKDLSAHRSVALPPAARSHWRSAIGKRPRADVRPYTSYSSVGPQYLLPGQSEYDSFDDATRGLYAQLIVLGLERWSEAMLDVVVRRYNDPSDRFTWPTCTRAFLEEAEWVPMARAGERQAWYYVRTIDAWSHGFSDEAAPNFVPLVPHALRRLTELRKCSRGRLEKLGMRFWDVPGTAPDRVRHLAELLREGDLGDTAGAAFRKAYEEAWEDVVQHDTMNPFDDQAEAWIAATVRSQLVPLRLDDGSDPIYVQDADSTQALRLLEQRPVPLVRLRRGIGGSVADILASVAGARIRRVSAAAVSVRVDGHDFEPNGVGELLTDGRRWLADLVTLLTELRSGRFRRLGSEALRRTRETVLRTRVVFAENIETLVDGTPVEGTNRALALPYPLQPTIVVARSASYDETSLLQAAAPAIAELIGYPDLGDSIRLNIIDLEEQGALEGGGPSLAAIADVIGEPESRLREIIEGAGESLLELARTLVPLVATADVAAASELWSIIDSFADETAIVAWLERRVGRSLAVSKLMSLSRTGDLEAARVALSVDLNNLNAAIAALGPPFEPLRNPEGIEQAFRHYVHRHRDDILAALRRAYRGTYQSFGPLDDYIARRDLTSLRSDPRWIDTYYDITDDVIRDRVDEWLAEAGATLSEADRGEAVPIDELRRTNRSEILKIATSARALIRAWERRTDRPPSGHPGDPTELVDDASAKGQLDFEPITVDRAIAWLAHVGRWPAEMPRSIEPGEVGLEAADLDEAQQRRDEEERRRYDAARQLDIDGEAFSAEQENYGVIVDVIRGSITHELLTSPAKLADLSIMPPARGRRSGAGAGTGVTAARHFRLSDVQIGAVGLAGEVVALEWLKKNYEDATDASWRSGYRNLVLGGDEGDDRLGYDFEINERQSRLLFEVKASVSDVCEFDLTDAEIRAAQSLRRRDRYAIIYVTHVLTSDERAVHLLPNPFGSEGVGRYQTVGSGLRLRFRRS